MDPITHGLIGATATQSLVSKEKLRPAALVGLVSAMLADLDIFIHNPNDPLLNLELHRQFSHSLIFIPIGALVASGLLWWFMRKKLSLKQLYGLSFVGYATSGLTDTLTSYGTKLLWPFLDERFAWNIISVFDPLFSVGVLTIVVASFYKKKPKIAWLSGIWIAFYLLIGFVQHERGQSAALEIARNRNHSIERLVVKPTIGNQLLWSTRYESNDTLYADGLRLSPFSAPTVYKGESTPLLNWRQKYESYKGTKLYNDIRRFDTLSEGFLIYHPHKQNIIGDGRYAMLPTTMSPLWGIIVDTSQAQRHLPFKTFRDASPEIQSTFLDMLLGKLEK